MRVAVLGVGLIGGSIGLAARRRLGAEVAGFDPDPRTLERALELAAVDRAAGTLAEAVDAADVVFCAAPVGQLPTLVAQALRASGADVVVSDVGSTKRQLVARFAGEEGGERFIGGHPVAGAETAGVESARPDLFEGARWYLAPAERSSGLLYERLQRTVAGLGARPQAIDAAAHDRLMATVSHLPHVIANVLVAQAAATASKEPEGLPEVGPSFRDSTRVAGANPPVWADIFAANRDSVADEIEAVVKRLRDAAELIRDGDVEAVERWHREALARRQRLLEANPGGGTLVELRLSVENRPGTVAEIALALGRAGVNIEDMALHPAADMRTGAISLWFAGTEQAERAAGVVTTLGHSPSLVARGG